MFIWTSPKPMPGARNSSSAMASTRRCRAGSPALVSVVPGNRLGGLWAGDGDRRVGLVICWLIALRVVDRRRAFFVVVMLALYPIFNFKGFKYNPDLLQLVTLAAGGAGLSGCVREAHRAVRHLARACRRAGADDQILGADHDRRGRHRRADASRPARLPALAGAMGCDRDVRGRDDPASVVAQAGRLSRR